jgi:hypothetical protein
MRNLGAENTGDRVNEEGDVYACPNGRKLKRFRRNNKTPRSAITTSKEIKDRSCIGQLLRFPKHEHGCGLGKCTRLCA